MLNSFDLVRNCSVLLAATSQILDFLVSGQPVNGVETHLSLNVYDDRLTHVNFGGADVLCWHLSQHTVLKTTTNPTGTRFECAQLVLVTSLCVATVLVSLSVLHSIITKQFCSR